MKPEDINRLVAAVSQMSNHRINNYIAPGLVSYLVGDSSDANGRVRLFDSTRPTDEFVTPHSHRFGFTALVLTGKVTNTLFVRSKYGTEFWLPSSLVRTEDKFGSYCALPDSEPQTFQRTRTSYEAGQTYAMSAHEIHSIRFSENTKVLIFEGPSITNKTVILEPWVDGKRVPTFRVEPWMFERGE